MKSIRLNLVSCASLLAMLFLFGCKKEDTKTNYFFQIDSYANKPYYFDLKYCSIMNDGITSKNTYNIYLMVSSSSIYITDVFGAWLTSDEYAVLFSLYSTDTTLPTGQYTFDAFSSEDAFTADYCEASFKGAPAPLNSGIINITHIGNRITLDFEFYNTTNPQITLKIKGQYSGLVNTLIAPSK